ncbi:MAG TPA: GNAT family N-acetyltransferase [Chloroflexota bacterium]|nr:GNAT family N-acetyltransferase [Chloroflexota bacterium]
MTDLNIRKKTAEDDAWGVALGNRLNDHLPPSTVEHFRHWERVEAASEKSHTERYIAEESGQPVGSVGLEKMWWVEREGGFWVSLRVDPNREHQGIGSRLYDWLLPRLGELGANRMYANVRRDRPDAQAFAEHRGFSTTGHADRWSRLHVPTANLDGYEGVENRLTNQGIAIKTLAELGETEELLRKLHELNDEAVRDIPMSETFTESPYEMFVEELHGPEMEPDRTWIALDGHKPIGIVIFPLRGETAAFNGFTGVSRDYRGRGVARALKFKSVEWARDHGVEYIYTANDVTNARMLSINNSLGYQELPISDEMTKDLS